MRHRVRSRTRLERPGLYRRSEALSRGTAKAGSPRRDKWREDRDRILDTTDSCHSVLGPLSSCLGTITDMFRDRLPIHRRPSAAHAATRRVVAVCPGRPSLSLILAVLLYLIFRLYRHELRADPPTIRSHCYLLALAPGAIAAVHRHQHEAGPGSDDHRDGPVQGADRRRSIRQHERRRPAARPLRSGAGQRIETGRRPRERFDPRRLDQRSTNGPFSSDDPTQYGKVIERVDAVTRHQVAERVLSPDGAMSSRPSATSTCSTPFSSPSDRRPAAGVGQAQARPGRTEARPGGQRVYRLSSSRSSGPSRRGGIGRRKTARRRGPDRRAAQLGPVAVEQGPRAGQRGVPVYFVAIGAKDPPPDLADPVA